jgi:hypothetical protein
MSSNHKLAIVISSLGPGGAERIAEYARVAIDERQKIITEYREYAKGYNLRAVKSFEIFLEHPRHG